MLNVGLAINQQTDDLVTTLKTRQGQCRVLVRLNLHMHMALVHHDALPLLAYLHLRNTLTEANS